MPAYIQQLHHGKMPIQLSMCKTRVDKLDEIDPAAWVSLHKHFLEDLVTDDEGRVVGYDMSAGPAVEYSRYAELWDMYIADVGHVPPIATTDQWKDKILGWRVWAGQQDGLSGRDQRMCNGPQTQVTSYSRANIGGVRFRYKRLDTKANGMPKSSKNSFFLADLKPGEKMSVGRFIAFYAVVPPGYSRALNRSYHNALQYAVTEWFATPHVHVTKSSRLPFVHNTIIDAHRTWPLGAVMPVPIALAPLDEHHDVPGGVKWGNRTLHYSELLAVLAKDDWAFSVRKPAAAGADAQ
jgi:hypothetical protein